MFSPIWKVHWFMSFVVQLLQKLHKTTTRLEHDIWRNMNLFSRNRASLILDSRMINLLDPLSKESCSFTSIRILMYKTKAWVLLCKVGVEWQKTMKTLEEAATPSIDTKEHLLTLGVALRSWIQIERCLSNPPPQTTHGTHRCIKKEQRVSTLYQVNNNTWGD